MKHEKLDEEEIWSAIRYLDPDEQKEQNGGRIVTVVATFALLLLFGSVWGSTLFSNKTTPMRFAE